MKKRVWKALLCCVLAMAMLPAAAFAAPEADITITDCGAWAQSTSRLVQRRLEVQRWVCN